MSIKTSNVKEVIEGVSALAVILSLVFVGLQVRETAKQTALNTQSLQVSVYQELISQISEFNAIIMDPDYTELYSYLRSDSGSWDALDEIETFRGRSLMYLLFRHADLAFYQYQQGMLPIERLHSSLAPLDNLSSPMFRSAWERSKQNFVPDFQLYIDTEFPMQ